MNKVGSFFLGAILFAGPVAGLVYLSNDHNPYGNEVASVLDEAAQADRDIMNAKSRADCETKAANYHIRRSIDALKQRELSSETDRALQSNTQKTGTRFEGDGIKVWARSSIIADTGFYFVACLKRLDKIGAVALKDSLEMLRERTTRMPEAK